MKDQSSTIEGLRTALESRLVIGQAEGLLMALHHLAPEAASRVLVRLSQERDQELHEVAADLVASQAGRRAGAPRGGT